MQRSPYTPGQIAQEIYGRERVLEDIRRDLSFVLVEPHLVGRISVFAGPRGVGKTSLLRAAQAYARDKGFETVFVTAGDAPLTQSLVLELEQLSSDWRGAIADTLRALLASVKLELGPVSFAGNVDTTSPTGGGAVQLQRVLVAAGRAAAERTPGLVIFVDEIQSADADGLRALAYAWQHMQAENRELPMAVYAAGLSHSQDVITDAVSFAERFYYEHLHSLDEGAAADALRTPAKVKGVSWSDAALEQALALAQGYPYFIQVIGDCAWESAGYPGAGSTIDIAQVRNALPRFEHMRNNFFRARWQKATEAEERLLTAMASLGDGPVKRGLIAEEMGKDSNAISMARRSLLDKGLIDTTGHGYLAFTAPGFAEFIRRETGGE